MARSSSACAAALSSLRDPPVMRQRPHHEIPGVHAARCLLLRAKAFGGIELRLDRGDDGFGDLVLHGEHVGDIAVEAFRPEMAAGGGVVELRGDPQLVAASPHAALDAHSARRARGRPREMCTARPL